MKVMAVFDRAVQAFGNPFVVHATGQGMRSFTDEVNNKESPFNAHPEDYDLYELGEYDQNNGSIVNDIRCISRAQDVKNTA